MKKNRLFIWLCMVIACIVFPETTQGQDITVTIGEKGTQSVNVPIRFRDKNSYTQVIYPADQLAPLTGKQIRTLTFYPKGTSTSSSLVPDSVKVYIGMTDKTDFSATAENGYVDLDKMDLCYHGVPDHHWNTENDYVIDLDSPFTYTDGSQHLIIAVLECGRGGYSSDISFYAYGAGSNRTLGYSKDSYTTFLAEYSNPAKGTLSSNSPVVKIEGGDAPVTPLPKMLTAELDFGQIRATTSLTRTVQIKNIGLDGLQITGVSADNAAFTIGEYPATVLAAKETAEIPVVFSPADAQSYQAQITVTTNYGEVGCTVTGEAYPANSIRIGDENSTSYTSLVPIYTTYAYSRTEIGFTAEELGSARGKRITDVSFYLKPGTAGLDEPVRMYMVANDRGWGQIYNYCNFISTIGLTPQYEGYMTSSPSGEVKIKLDRPFAMEDGKSMVWIIFERDGGKTNGENFVYTPQSDNCTVYAYSSTGSVAVGANSSVGKNRPNTSFVYADLASGPEISTDKTLDFGLLKASERVTKKLKIYNTGIADLQVTGFSVDAPFAFEEIALPLTVPPGEFAEAEVTYSSAEAGEHTAAATVTTDVGNAVVMLSGKSYPADAYFQHFDGGLTTPKAWRNVREDESRSTSYSAKTSGGFNGSGYVEVGTNYGVNRLVSPQAGGLIYFYAKKSSSASYNSPIEFKVYVSDDLKTWGEPLLDIGSELTSYWQRYEVTVPEGVYIGFYMNYGALDEFFAWEANVPQYDIAMGEIRNLSYSINEGAKTEIVFTCYNGGTEPVPAGAYRFEVVNAAGDATPLYSIAGNIGLPVADTAYVFSDSLVINLADKVKTDMQLYVRSVYDRDQDSTNNATAQKDVTVVPYISELAVSDGTSADRPKDVGIFEAGTSVTARVTLTNKGIAPLEITSVEAAPPFSVDKTHISIPGKIGGAEQQEVLTITVNGEPGVYAGEIRLIHEGLGDRVIYLTVRIRPAGSLLESFEGDEMPPVFWTRVCDSRETPSERKGWERNTYYCYKNSTTAIAGETSCMMHTATLADTLVTPRLKVKEGDTLSFYAGRRYANESTYLQVLYSADKVSWHTLLDLNSGSGFTSGIYEFNPYSCTLPAGEYYIGFASIGAMLDMIQGPEVVYADHDLAVTGFNGPSAGVVNHTSVYALSLRNMGKQTESDYEVTLFANDSPVAVLSGPELARLAAGTAELEWTPYEAGEYRVYARVNLAGDAVPDNNVSDTLTVTVAAEVADMRIDVGTPETAEAILNAYYCHSAVRALYTPAELTGLTPGSAITKIAVPYYSKAYNGDFRLWIGNTTDETVASSSGHISVEGMTLAYSGNPFQQADGSASSPVYLECTLAEPFVYTGRTLAVVMAADSSGYVNSGLYLYRHNTSQAQSEKYQQDQPKGTPFPKAPEVFSQIATSNVSYVPVITFYVSNAAPVVSGTVVDKSDNPVTDAEVTLTSDKIIYKNTSDQTGKYELTVFQGNRTYTVNIFKEGYKDYSAVIEVGETDIALEPVVLQEAGSDVLVISEDSVIGSDAAYATVVVERPDIEVTLSPNVSVQTDRLVLPGSGTGGSGQIRLEEGATFTAGQIIYEKQIPATDKWHLVAMPFEWNIDELTIKGSTGRSVPETIRILRYDRTKRAAGQYDQVWYNATTGIIPAYEGVAIQISREREDGVICFRSTGSVTFNGENKADMPLAYAAGNEAVDSHWNMLGIPYLSSVKTKGVFVGESSAGAAVYRYDTERDLYTTHLYTDPDEQAVNPFEGFFLQAENEGESLTYHYYLPMDVQATPVYPRVELTMDNDRVTIVLDEAASPDFRVNEDGVKLYGMNSTTPALCLIAPGGEELSVSVLPEITTELPLGIRAGQAGEHTIGLGDRTDYEPTAVMLEDRVTESTTDLMKGTYTFTTDEPGLQKDRFLVKVVKVVDGLDQATGREGYVYRNGSGRLIVTGVPAGERITITEIGGRVVTSVLSEGKDLMAEPGAGVFLIKAGSKVWKIVL